MTLREGGLNLWNFTTHDRMGKHTHERTRKQMSIMHTIRKDGKGHTIKARLTPIRAIRFQCVECCGFSQREDMKCKSELCSLFPFRFGNAHSGKKGGTKPPVEGTLTL
jgi:hypothetical protein